MVNNLFSGNIYVTHKAIATIASQSALESYGVVGMASKNLARGIANLLTKDPTTGVEIHFDGETLVVELYIIIEYGTRISSVAKSVSNSVQYQIEKAIQISVQNVNVHVRGLRISNPD